MNVNDCPKCGKRPYTVLRHVYGKSMNRWVVVCIGCYRQTKPHIMKLMAVREWNNDNHHLV